MKPFAYHAGQRDVQREANTVPCADKLDSWVGPVVDFAQIADLVILAAASDDGIALVALSGAAPLVRAHMDGDTITLAMPHDVLQHIASGTACGGIVINPALARRSRVAGVLREAGTTAELTCDVAFTNCRKYMAVTSSTGDTVHVGPSAHAPVSLADAWLAGTIARADTAFLLTVTPQGVGDVSHRGGPAGFLHFDVDEARLSWTEYLGDGMFVSTGNVRATPQAKLLVLDTETGDAVLLSCVASYENVRRDRHARLDALLQNDEPFPVQGRMTCDVVSAERLTALCLPRTRHSERQRISSADPISVQHPQ